MFARITRRRLGAVAATLAIVGAGLGSGVQPAAADVPPHAGLAFLPTSGTSGAYIRNGVRTLVTVGSSSQAFAGNFSSGAGAEVFQYTPGPGGDRIVRFTNASPPTVVTSAISVGGTYTPIPGDFDGNGYTDVLWYAPGTDADRLWLFTSTGSHSEVAVNISGTYRPTVLDANGDDRMDILWYSPSGGDSLWLFGAGATSHVSKSISIGSGYQIVAGHFGNPAAGQPKDRVVFYNPSGTDYFWTFDTAGNHTSAVLPNVNGNYTLLPGQFFEETYGSLFFYGPGSLPEQLWAFGPGDGGDVSPQAPNQVTGTYTATAGDFDDNGFTDIAFTSGGTTRIWNTTDSGTHTESVFSTPSGTLIRPLEVH